MNELRIARAAGILEGEGCFRTVSGRHSPIVACQMTDLDVLEELQDLFGGTLHTANRAEAHYKPVWVWTVQGDLAQSVMEQVRPFLFRRRREAIDKALATWQARKDVLEVRRVNGEKAGNAYLRGEGSLRQIAKRFDVSYETVRQYADRLSSPV
jgi:hypothetical protein